MNCFKVRTLKIKHFVNSKFLKKAKYCIFIVVTSSFRVFRSTPAFCVPVSACQISSPSPPAPWYKYNNITSESGHKLYLLHLGRVSHHKFDASRGGLQQLYRLLVMLALNTEREKCKNYDNRWRLTKFSIDYVVRHF